MRSVIPDDARLEIKFVAYEADIPLIVRWLKVHRSGFAVPFPARWINNVYFDSYDYFAYAENLFGSSNRTKVRYRWYGTDPYPASGELEVKCKRNCFSWKQRYSVTLEGERQQVSWREIRQDVLDQMPADGAIWLQTHPQPVIINRYYRHYYLSGDGRIRATIDSGQSVFDQRYKPKPNITRSIHPPGTAVLEFKFSRGDRALASDIIQGLPLRVSRHSKYMTGVHGIQGF